MVWISAVDLCRERAAHAHTEQELNDLREELCIRKAALNPPTVAEVAELQRLQENKQRLEDLVTKADQAVTNADTPCFAAPACLGGLCVWLVACCSFCSPLSPAVRISATAACRGRADDPSPVLKRLVHKSDQVRDAFRLVTRMWWLAVGLVLTWAGSGATLYLMYFGLQLRSSSSSNSSSTFTTDATPPPASPAPAAVVDWSTVAARTAPLLAVNDVYLTLLFFLGRETMRVLCKSRLAQRVADAQKMVEDAILAVAAADLAALPGAAAAVAQAALAAAQAAAAGLLNAEQAAARTELAASRQHLTDCRLWSP